MSEKYHRALTLATIPEEEWQLIARHGFDLIWLMGVWQRSPEARQQALISPALRQQYDRVLPGWTNDDIAGSPYAILNYGLDPALGKPAELAQLKPKLNHLGLGLVLDFVPNHLALDHPWTHSHPKWFVPGSETDVRAHPEWFFPVEDVYLAHGRDPYFPPWTDTVQVNFYSPDLRQALTNELIKITEVADGVRCDMAMLALNEVFERVWGTMLRDHPHPASEFWTEAIGQVKQHRPDFLFLAEAYWGIETKLQQIGFDFTYDKLFYDRLLSSRPGEISSYLTADAQYQEHSIRFIENHDELRAIAAFGRECSLAAAVILTTVPGLRLFHDGQLEGRHTHLPIQLVREPKEATDAEVIQFYNRLLAVTSATAFHDGKWRLIEVSQTGGDNESHYNLLAWLWHYGEQLKIVVINYSPNPAQGWLKLPSLPKTTRKVTLHNELTGVTHTQDTGEIDKQRLYVNFVPYHAEILAVVGAGS